MASVRPGVRRVVDDVPIYVDCVMHCRTLEQPTGLRVGGSSQSLNATFYDAGWPLHRVETAFRRGPPHFLARQMFHDCPLIRSLVYEAWRAPVQPVRKTVRRERANDQRCP
jgi:hypothetical protein